MLSVARALFGEEELSGVAACTVFTRSEFLFELFAPLANGGRAILLDELRQILVPPVKEQVRLLSTTPAAIRALLQANNLPASVRTVNLHGEILASKAVDLVYERSSVQKVNHIYSAPEMAGFGACASRTSGGPAVMGRAVANNQAYLLDGQLQPVPLGAAGELCLSGEHLGRGYHRNEALTRERFVPHPFRKEAGARLYRTGDLCRFLPDGNLVYVGRMARRALVGGNCVHPESIETVLSEHPGVLQTSVLAGSIAGEPEPGILAYVVPQQNTNLTESDLRQFLKTRIQEQWMPGTFLIVSELPMRPNGQPDYAAFPTQALKVEEKPVDAQMTPLQETLAGMWQDVIGIDDVGIHDNFFDLGGHSVLVTQIVARIRKNLNVNLSLRSVFDHPTIAELAAVIEDVLPAEADTIMNRVQPRKSELLRKE
jgi:acyl-CoA synthetase (AMP-forming)/AMP-acid ligase II